MTIKRLNANEFANLTNTNTFPFAPSTDAQNQANVEAKLSYLRDLVQMSHEAQDFAKMLPGFKPQTQTYPDLFIYGNLENVRLEADELVVRACEYIKNTTADAKRIPFFFHNESVSLLMRKYNEWLG